MRAAVQRNIGWCDLLVMAAAVADYKVMNPPDRKIKKGEFVEGLARVDLVETVDILKSVAEKKGNRVFVGFALETDNAIENARAKLESKSLDMIVINNPREEGAGFGTDTNKVTLFFKNSAKKELPLMPKYEVALKILDEVKVLLEEKFPN
jgi:phosphopantothenoylcysteine decarboxylase/phosphopantothenate--cysteine ligase